MLLMTHVWGRKRAALPDDFLGRKSSLESDIYPDDAILLGNAKFL